MVRLVLQLVMTAAALGLLAVPSSAQKGQSTQGGSLPLADVLEIAKPYPNLQTQVKLRLIATGLARDKVICTGQRLANAWVHLSAARIGPYACTFGRRTLTIRTEPTYFDRAGYKLKPDDPALAAKATRIAEARLTWSWK
jgi:hypothetical protein